MGPHLHTDFLRPSLAKVDMEPSVTHRSQILKMKMRWILLRGMGAVALQTLQKLDVLQWRRQHDSQREEQDEGAPARELHRGTPGNGVRAAGLTQLVVLQEKQQNVSVTLINPKPWRKEPSLKQHFAPKSELMIRLHTITRWRHLI